MARNSVIKGIINEYVFSGYNLWTRSTKKLIKGSKDWYYSLVSTGKFSQKIGNISLSCFLENMLQNIAKT